MLKFFSALVSSDFANSAMAAAGFRVKNQVPSGKFVPTNAVGFSGINCRPALPSQDVGPTGCGFQMGRPNAMTNKTKMVKSQSARDGANSQFVGISVRSQLQNSLCSI